MEEKYNSRLGKSYQAIIRKIASLYGITSNEAEVFYLKQKPALRKQLEEMVRSHFETVSANIKSAALEAWAFSSMMYDKEVGKRPAIHLQGQAAKDAVKAFNEAKSKYLADLDKRLSKRVWKWEKQFMAEIELSMQVGFKEGSSAAKLSRDVRQYLNNPEMLFRRVRDEFGQLHLSKAAAAYHPGQGVYRSSYKNALRMTGSEIDRASRLSEHHRRLADPDVVGIEIKLSNNHTLNGVPFTDICDHLAGQYPKDFVFTGWHPKCRCKSTSILVTNEEFDTITDDILDGGVGNINSKNMVTDVPGNYKKWVKDNEERVLRSKEKGTLPYFLKENPQYGPDLKATKQHPTLIRSSEVVMEYANGGKIVVYDIIDRTASDYMDVLVSCDHFARQGHVTYVMPRVHHKDPLYDKLFGKLKGTPYDGKCPDFKVGEHFYEHEGHTSDNPKKALRNMMNRGLKQSDRIVIDDCGVTDDFIKRISIQRIKENQNISEVWIKNGNQLVLAFKSKAPNE